MARARARITRSLSAAGMRGSPTITDLPPPWGRPAAAYFSVIARMAMHDLLWTKRIGETEGPSDGDFLFTRTPASVG